MKSTILAIAKMLVFLAVGLTILWLLYNNLNVKFIAECALKGIPESECSLLDKLYQDLRSANVFWLVIICICFFISNLSRATRWQQLLASLGYQTRWANSFHCVMIGYFANLGFPRIGEVVRAGTFSKYENVPFEKVIGTVAIDRILDVICFGIVFLLALLFQFDLLGSYIIENAQLDLGKLLNNSIAITLLAVIAIGLVLAWYYRSRLAKISLLRKVMSMLKGFLEGLRSLRNVEKISLLIFYSILIWVMYFLMTFLCFKSFEPTAHLGVDAGLLIFVFGSLGMIIPTPGGMGSYHALVMAGLALYGINQNDAFSFAMIIFFTINIFGNVLFGLIALFLLPGYNRSYQPARA
ncbi:MAG: flippase-like domain-containing protein [Saprospiraceae bacterium]|nr:flippase-like domain-containing protein [Saprospiraceae bacterium]